LKRLLILRHAKSSWKHPALEDHDRPMNKRGKRAAPRVGRLLRDEGLLPQLAVASTAKRARQTLERVLEASRASCETMLLPELYLAGTEEFLAVLRALPESVSPVLVVGHNPGLEELVGALTGRAVTLPTAALAVVDCGCARWGDLSAGGTESLVRVWTPRELVPD
jgi:phosphohistidine phosphatase